METMDASSWREMVKRAVEDTCEILAGEIEAVATEAQPTDLDSIKDSIRQALRDELGTIRRRRAL